MAEDFFHSKDYQKFIAKLKRMMPATENSSYHDFYLQSYWEMGKEILKEKGKTGPREKESYVAKIAADLGKNRTYIYELQQFFQRFPRGVPAVAKKGFLKWSHIKEVLTLENSQEALFYLKQAHEDEFSSSDIRKAIKGDLYKIMQNKNEMEHILKRPTSPAFVFPARWLSNYDGDTPTVMVDQGFDTWRKMTVRLRGLNTAELHGEMHEQALEAKAFLEKTLSPLERFLLITYKTDSFGRFIGDILYHPIWKDYEKIFYEGIFLNAHMIQMGIAKPMFF